MSVKRTFSMNTDEFVADVSSLDPTSVPQAGYLPNGI